MNDIKPQRGATNAKWCVANATTSERTHDILRCHAGVGHDVAMIPALRNGVRTGQLIAWCQTCRTALPASTSTPPTSTAIKAKRQDARLIQAVQKQDAQARREYIKRAVAAGERKVDIANRLGLTKQRVSQIINGRGRKSA